MRTDGLSLAIVSDEISDDFREAVRIGKSWGIDLFELRNTGGARIPDIPDAIKKEIPRVIDGEGISITAISPGLFKLPLADEDAIRKQISFDLPRSFDFARVLNCGLVIVFGFQRDERPHSDQAKHAMEYFQSMAEVAEREQITIAIENEYGFVCDSGTNTVAVVSAVNSPSIKVNWDPCNAFGCSEEPFPNGYEAVKPFIANIHAKDTIRGSHLACVPIGEGCIDWKGHIRALKREAVVSHVTIETHCEPLVEQSRKNVESLRRMLREFENEDDPS